MLSKEVLMKLEEAENAKDLQSMAKKLGYDLTDAEAEKVFAMFERELSEDELEKVAGGYYCVKCVSYCPHEDDDSLSCRSFVVIIIRANYRLYELSIYNDQFRIRKHLGTNACVE